MVRMVRVNGRNAIEAFEKEPAARQATASRIIEQSRGIKEFASTNIEFVRINPPKPSSSWFVSRLMAFAQRLADTFP